MSARHPIVAITGSSGAGTTSVTQTFEKIFRRERVAAAVIEGDSFHRYARAEMREAMAARGDAGHFSHFGPEANLLAELEALFREYAESGTGRRRRYVHDEEEARRYGAAPTWRAIPTCWWAWCR
jgi:phosphoribulokinase